MKRTKTFTPPQLRVMKEILQLTSKISWVTPKEVAMRQNTKEVLLRRDWIRVAFEGKWFRGYALTEIGREIAKNN